ncbi:MAG: hypothetical protein AB1778_07925 [Candidatus Bipolaricaulota bacterium]
MRCIVDLAPRPAALGLSVDEVLLDRARQGENSLRLWSSDLAVVVGRSQCLADEVDEEAAALRGVDVVRRASGGGAVLHYPGNLCASVAIAGGERLSVAQATSIFGGIGMSSLRSIGASVSLVGSSLFALGGAKVSGAAQARRAGALLYHWTVLVEPPPFPMADVLRALRLGYLPRGRRSEAARTSSLYEILGGGVCLRGVAEAICREIERRLGKLRASSLSGEEAAAAAALAREKYGSRSWTALR